MKLIKNIPSVISRVVPKSGAITKRRCYSGSIMKDKYDNIFYRKRNRYEEVIAGAKSYRIGIETHCFKEIEEYNVELIMIETEYNIWEISVNEFIEKHEPHPGIKQVVVCKEDFFTRTKKKGLSHEKNKSNRGDSDPLVREIKREARQNAMESKAENNQLIDSHKKQQKQKQKKQKQKEEQKNKVKFGSQTSLF